MIESMLALACALLQLVVSGEQCGTIGYTDQDDHGSSDDAFYLNRGDGSIAGCSGMVTSVNFCVDGAQNDDSNSDEMYMATFAIYRLDGATYRNVSSAIAVKVTESHLQSVFGANFGSSSFGCSSFTLNSPLPIEAGDALGVCVFNPSNAHRLNLVGGFSGSGVMDGDLWRIRVGSGSSHTAPASCTEITVPEIVTLSDSDTDASSNRAVYLFANIEPIALPLTTLPATEPTTPPATEALTIPADTTTAVLLPTSMAASDLPVTDTTTSHQANGSDNRSSDSSVTIAVVVVIILIFMIIAIVLVVVVVLMRRQRQTTKSYPVADTGLAIDNAVYTTAGDHVPEVQDGFHLPQSQEHIYELENSVNKGSEYVYAQVGPYDEMQGREIVYESPLDSTAISYSKLLEKNKEEDIYMSENPYEVPASRENDIYAQLDTWGVRHLKIQEFEIVSHLGSGQFGSVEQGVWKRQGTRPVDVALKSLTKTSEEDKVKFLQEAAIMAQFRHPNVVMLYGVIVKGNPMMLVVELAKKGDLREYLLSIRPDPGELIPTGTSKILLKFSQQVALGMQYLSAKGFVHRDLAARNVLLTDNNVCKVADFGMSRDLADENYYVSHSKDKIPVKWTAPEAIHYKKYSTASDVWAYGCLLYEIWSVGHKPFEGVPNLEAIRLVDNGKRLSPPPGCPKMVYELMTLCWHPETSQRVAFRDIVLTLSGNEKVVLSIPKDSSTNPLAGVLGVPLEAGENMYSELQRRYVDFHHGNRVETDGDYFEIH